MNTTPEQIQRLQNLRSFLDPTGKLNDEEYRDLLMHGTQHGYNLVGRTEFPESNWPFDGSVKTDVSINDVDSEFLKFANDRYIALLGIEYVSGVMLLKWLAGENATRKGIDEMLIYSRMAMMPSFVYHPSLKRSEIPLGVTAHDTEVAALQEAVREMHPADLEIMKSTGEVPESLGRGMTRSRTTEMLMQLEDDQIAFGLEALNKYLEEGIRPGVLSGASGITATAYPNDIEERRAAFAAEQSGVEIKTSKGLYETKSGASTFQVICDETNNPPDVVETGDLNVDILLDLNHISAKLSDMGISWQGGSSQNIDHDYAAGYAKHILQLRDDHDVEPEPITLIDGKLVAGETKRENHARVIDLFKHAKEVGIGKFCGIDYADNPKGSQIITAYDVSLREDNAVQTVTRKDLDGNMFVLSTHSICAYDVARITDKQTRQMQHHETAELLTEMRKESGSLATVSPAYVAAMNAQDARKKQKKVKTKNRNKRAKR